MAYDRCFGLEGLIVLRWMEISFVIMETGLLRTVGMRWLDIMLLLHELMKLRSMKNKFFGCTFLISNIWVNSVLFLTLLTPCQ